MAQSGPAHLLGLPRETIISLADYVHDIEDFVNFSSTCRTLRVCLFAASTNTILRLATISSRTFFRPSPHFLVAATARELATWAIKSTDNVSALHTAFRKGVDGLLDLSIQHCGLSMSDISNLHLQRFETINPVTDLIDLCVGTQWYSTPDFWNGGVEDAYTIDVDPPETYFHLVTYGELFGPSLNEFIESGGTVLSPLLSDINLRLDYVKYCIPDWACYKCQTSAWNGLGRGNENVHPLRATGAIGPYAPFASEKTLNDFREHGNQIGLLHMLESPRWNPPWAALRESLGGDFKANSWERDWESLESLGTGFEDLWKQHLWESVVWYQGMESMKLLRAKGWGEIGGKKGREGLGGMEETMERLRRLREKIQGMERASGAVVVGRQRTYKFPFLRGDLEICSSGYASGTWDL